MVGKRRQEKVAVMFASCAFLSSGREEPASGSLVVFLIFVNLSIESLWLSSGKRGEKCEPDFVFIIGYKPGNSLSVIVSII
jgi:hypothetical protein